MADEPFKENPFNEVGENGPAIAKAGYRGIVQALEKKQTLSEKEKELLSKLRKKLSE